MIDKERITKLTEEALAGTDLFITAVTVKPGNKIMVFLDGDNGVSIDDCIKVSKHIESNFDRDKEDFELDVSSHGLNSPLVLPRQFANNTGKEIVVVMKDGMKHTGIIKTVSETGFSIEPVSGKKKKQELTEPIILQIDYLDTKEVKIHITFK